MSSSGQGAAGGEESAVVRPEGQPIQRHGLTTRRIREDLQNVVRSAICNFINFSFNESCFSSVLANFNCR